MVAKLTWFFENIFFSEHYFYYDIHLEPGRLKKERSFPSNKIILPLSPPEGDSECLKFPYHQRYFSKAIKQIHDQNGNNWMPLVKEKIAAVS